MDRAKQTAKPTAAGREPTEEFKIYSYVVDHDEGCEPNPYFGSCTLCRCKYSRKAEATQGRKGQRNIVELANEGDWVIGTGGASKRSAGLGKLIYAMRVDEKLTRLEFFTAFKEKKPERPRGRFQEQKQFALVSRHFYYFGEKAHNIQRFKLEANRRGFHYVDPKDFRRFQKWLEKKFQLGRHGEPCAIVGDECKGRAKRKSSC